MHITTLFGKRLSYWADLASVMEKHQVSSPKELDFRLSPNRRILKVVDALNVKRELGSLIETPQRLDAPLFSLSTHTSMTVSATHPYTPVEPVIHKRVDFHLDYTTSPDGYTKKAVFRTSSPLDTLMTLQHFRLPGESEDAARERLYRQ